MKNILVTGGAGYIGSHTVVELVSAGYRPVIIDNFSNSDQSALDGIKQITGQKVNFYKGDYQDSDFLEAIIAKESIVGVIHFAAYKAVGESVDNPLKYYENNVAGLVSLLQTLEIAGVTNLVFSSSCTVYGNADQLPVTEQTPIQPPASPYGTTKQMGEMIIRDTTLASQQLRSLALRYFNPVGAHPSAKIGELQIGTPTILVPLLTQAVAGLRKELTVYGDNYNTPDGTCIRDYIHVIDLAKAHIKALEYLDAKQPKYYDVFNIGTGKGSSVLELIQTFEKVNGKKVPHQIGPRRPGDVVATYAAVDKAKQALGWQAELTLEDALRDAWHWQQAIAP